MDCCSIKNKIKEYPLCDLTIDNPPDDPVFGVNNRTCTTLFRALTSKDYGCPLYPTTFVSNIYSIFII